MVSQTPKHSDRRPTIVVADTFERPRNSGLHCPDLDFVRTSPSGCQPKHSTPPIARMTGAAHHLLLHQPR